MTYILSPVLFYVRMY